MKSLTTLIVALQGFLINHFPMDYKQARHGLKKFDYEETRPFLTVGSLHPLCLL